MDEISAPKGSYFDLCYPNMVFSKKHSNFSPKKIVRVDSKIGEKLVVSDFDEIAATPPKSTLLITKMGLKLL